MSRNQHTLHLPRRLQAKERTESAREPARELHMQAEAAPTVEPEAKHVPQDWPKGALLNVRNYGSEYIVTLYPEEFHVEHPGRALRYTNVGELQNFVSRWYMREHYDARAR